VSATVQAQLTPDEEAQYARELERNPLLEAIFATLHADAMRTWHSSSSVAQREELWHRVMVIAQLREQIKSRIDNMKLVADKRRRDAMPRN
jgi:hypothetical protein